VTVFEARRDEEAERLRVAREQYDAGKIPKSDLLRAEAELADAEQMRTNAIKDAGVAAVDLREAIGLPEGTTADLTGALAVAADWTAPEERLDRAVRDRPELRAARERVRASEAEVAAAQGEYRPQVYGTAMADVNATRRRGTGGGTLLGVTVGLPLLDG